ncbi:MAG: MerR family transcriptional regulator [Pelagimonas sp.]|uniref:MerR family transcriptional regulator n=1 Tax=Pelagimonas sp. TaxID=2073170 RepID=UPI003D6B4384
MAKSRDAFRTISEVAEWLETPAHVLRFWESKFTQIKPVKRAGGRRYYRPADMELLGGIKRLLHEDGMTIKGVQKVLREQGVRHVSSLNTIQVDDDGTSASGEVIEDAPFVEVDVPDSVVAFPGTEKAEPERTADMFAEQGQELSDAAEPDLEPPAILEDETDVPAEDDENLDAALEADGVSELRTSEPDDQEAEPEETGEPAADALEEPADSNVVEENDSDPAEETSPEITTDQAPDVKEPEFEEHDAEEDDQSAVSEPANLAQDTEAQEPDVSDESESYEPIEDIEAPEADMSPSETVEVAPELDEHAADGVEESPTDEIAIDDVPLVEEDDSQVADHLIVEQPLARPALLSILARIETIPADHTTALRAHCDDLRAIQQKRAQE